MKALIADDHPLLRDATRLLLDEVRSGCEILEAGTCGEVMDAVRQHPDLDLILLDLAMPDEHGDGSGLELLADLDTGAGSPAIIILSASEDPEDIKSALNRGARGYIPKSLATKVLRAALELVLSGGVYVPPHYLQGASSTGDTETRPPVEPSAPLLERLTGRQREILELVRLGKSNKEIGRELSLSPETVKAHLATIYRTLGVGNRTQAIRAMET